MGSDSFRRKSRPTVLALVFSAVTLTRVVLAGLWGIDYASGQTVITESKPRLLPAGPGRKPFDVTRHTITLSEITDGGPPRDGIPALDNPKFIFAQNVGRLLKDSQRVLGVFLNGEAKAYPVRILNWHELVNDTAGGRAILVSW